MAVAEQAWLRKASQQPLARTEQQTTNTRQIPHHPRVPLAVRLNFCGAAVFARRRTCSKRCAGLGSSMYLSRVVRQAPLGAGLRRAYSVLFMGTDDVAVPSLQALVAQSCVLLGADIRIWLCWHETRVKRATPQVDRGPPSEHTAHGDCRNTISTSVTKQGDSNGGDSSA